MRLATKGITNISLTKRDVPTSQIEKVFGPKISKNGYRYGRKVFTQVVQSIFELYKRVMGKHKMTNGQINKAFA
jgi:3-oxoacyl-[acyl-carrier-protein] synthase III